MPLLLIELKWNKTDRGAIEQIKNNDYPQILKDYGGNILLVDINYDAKSKVHTFHLLIFLFISALTHLSCPNFLCNSCKEI